MAEHIRLDFQGVGYGESAVGGEQFAAIAHLPTRLGIKRRLVEHHYRFIPRLDKIDPAAVLVDSKDCPFVLEAFVAVESRGWPAVRNAFLHRELACRPGAL